ncbi:hypothetical protein [Pleurocapsa sp. CCALA 161]|uniref:hypothetical protein n=1 Tax=Pleurocapsa sp. CCALA 161 TaxID=2107688 RepID=UPI0013048B59|nr:hypothetical protein [Pleurocapsa sp. CCALA 161]
MIDHTRIFKRLFNKTEQLQQPLKIETVREKLITTDTMRSLLARYSDFLNSEYWQQ